MSRRLNGTQNPPIPKIAMNGWGPNYPIGMTDVDLLLFSPTVYDLYRTNGGMGGGMVDYFQYDPITQYGNLSSNVALAGGSSDLWFSLMNHRYPYNKYPFKSVENSTVKSPKQLKMSSIEEITGVGFFRSLNDEGNHSSYATATRGGTSTPTATVTTAPTGTRGGSSPEMIATTTLPPTSTTAPKSCPPGTKLMYNKCVPIRAVSGSTVVPRPTGVSGATPTPVPVAVPVPVPVVPVAPVVGGGAIGGGGGMAEEAPAEASAEKGAGMEVEKVKYTIPLIIAVLGAVAGYFYAKKYSKKVSVFAIGGAVLGFAVGYFYTKFKMKKDAESASKATEKK